jgi:hypothetical protein
MRDMCPGPHGVKYMYIVVADARDRRRLVNDDSVARVSVTYQRYYYDIIITQTGRATIIYYKL